VLLRPSLFLALAALPVLLSPAPAAPAAPGPGAVLVMHERLFRAMDAGDVSQALEFLHADIRPEDEHRPRPCTTILPTLEGGMVSGASFDESRAALTGWIESSADAGGQWSTRLVSGYDDCFSGELSYAVLEFERVHEKDGARTATRYRSTSLVTYDGGWKLTHWHVSRAPEQTGKAGGKVRR
jgi:hypothetical protein